MHEVVEPPYEMRAIAAREVSSRILLEALRDSKCLLDGFFAASPAGLAILDRHLRFQRVNDTLAAINGVPAEDHLGKTVREVIPELADQVEPYMRNVLFTGQKMLNRELCGPIPGGEGAIGYWVANYFPIPSESGGISRIGCVVLDITDCRRAEESLRRLSGRLMELQDEERRRIARELHDSIGQCLTAIKINLDILDRSLSQPDLDLRTAKALAEALSLTDQCSSDTRTISYLLHPPLLDERGLASAIRWYADGFAQRSGIRLSMDLPSDDIRLPQPVETTLFRIVQESLTNIHRHSGSTMAEVRLLTDAESVILEVRDEGHGMPAASLRRCNGSGRMVGVGIAGMRERVRQFGGKLDILSDSRGTQVRATLPLGGEV
jgi:PAS domain S-box-containing protein